MKEEFAHPGGQAFAKENQDKSPVIVKFDEKPDEEKRVKMRELGLKWNTNRGEWQGYADISGLKKIFRHEAQIMEATAYRGEERKHKDDANT